MSTEELELIADKLAERHSKEISSEDHVKEMNYITMVHNDNFDRKQLAAFYQNCFCHCFLLIIFL